MNALVTCFLIHASDAEGTELKLGMQPGTRGALAAATLDQLNDYMRPFAVTASRFRGFDKVVLHDGLPEELVRQWPGLTFVEMPRQPAGENAWMARYRVLGEYLATAQHERLWFCDVNDVAVLADPFDWWDSLGVPDEMPIVGEEWVEIGRNQWYTYKYPQFPDAMREFFERRMADQLPVSAGLWAARVDVARRLVSELTALFDEYREAFSRHPLTAWDMMGLNYVLFRGGEFGAIKQNHVGPDSDQAGVFVRNGAARRYTCRLANPILHCRKSTTDLLAAAEPAYDTWSASRVLEMLNGHPNRERVAALLSEPRCWGPERGYSPVDRCVGLAELVLTMFPRTGLVVETGRYWGVSTECLALLLPEARIVSVDNFDHQAAFPRLAVYPNVRLIKGDALEFANSLEGQSVSALYMDSDHSYEHVRGELSAMRPKMAWGGVMAGHDYCASGLDVVRAVNDFFGCPPQRVTSDSSWGYVLL